MSTKAAFDCNKQFSCRLERVLAYHICRLYHVRVSRSVSGDVNRRRRRLLHHFRVSRSSSGDVDHPRLSHRRQSCCRRRRLHNVRVSRSSSGDVHKLSWRGVFGTSIMPTETFSDICCCGFWNSYMEGCSTGADKRYTMWLLFSLRAGHMEEDSGTRYDKNH